MSAVHITFFESLLLLLGVAIVLLQVSRRLAIPYPTCWRRAGVGLGARPRRAEDRARPRDGAGALRRAGAGRCRLRLSGARCAQPLAAALRARGDRRGAERRGRRGWLGVALAGLPIFAALRARCDRGAARRGGRTAVLRRRQHAAPDRRDPQGREPAERRLGAPDLRRRDRGHTPRRQPTAAYVAFALRVAIAVPGGVLLGIALALLFRRYHAIVRGDARRQPARIRRLLRGLDHRRAARALGGALPRRLRDDDRARRRAHHTPPGSRIQSFAVWDAAVFLLNVLAFLLMGLQAREIIGGMSPGAPARGGGLRRASSSRPHRGAHGLGDALRGGHARQVRRSPATGGVPSLRQSILVGWCGMRGLLTLATAFALPAGFPQRDLIVLTAFAVVLATLVIQGLTITPLIKLLKIDGHQAQQNEFVRTRRSLAEAALAFLATIPASAEAGVTRVFELDRDAWSSDNPSPGAEQRRKLTLKALNVQRRSLTLLHERNEISEETFLVLQQELDWKKLSLSTADSDTIEET